MTPNPPHTTLKRLGIRHDNIAHDIADGPKWAMEEMDTIMDQVAYEAGGCMSGQSGRPWFARRLVDALCGDHQMDWDDDLTPDQLRRRLACEAMEQEAWARFRRRNRNIGNAAEHMSALFCIVAPEAARAKT